MIGGSNSEVIFGVSFITFFDVSSSRSRTSGFGRENGGLLRALKVRSLLLTNKGPKFRESDVLIS